MGLSAVVENFRSLKQTVKKPIVAFRDTVHQAYTKVYVGSPERVDEFYDYIKVYDKTDHNDLCMMSITADINRFAMIRDKQTFFHVLKLERHFDRMIAARGKEGITGDMGIQVLSGHNMSFMAKYRRYKARAAAKEMKRNTKRHEALNVKRLSGLPLNDVSRIPIPSKPVSRTVQVVEESPLSEEDKELEALTKEIREVVIVEVPKKEVMVNCELTKAETVEAAPVLNSLDLALPPATHVPVAHPDGSMANLTSRIKNEPKIGLSKIARSQKFKVSKPVLRKSIEKSEKTDKREVEKSLVLASPGLLEDVMDKMKIEEQKVPSSSSSKSKVVVESSDEFDNCSDSDSDSDSDGSDIEELEKIEDKDVDALEYEMI